MLSPHFSEMRPPSLKLFFQWGSFDIGLIRVGASPELTTVTSTMSAQFAIADCCTTDNCILTV